MRELVADYNRVNATDFQSQRCMPEFVRERRPESLPNWI
jgi:hypothetical protein